MKLKSDVIALVFMAFSLAAAAFALGAASYHYNTFPHPQIAEAVQSWRDLLIRFDIRRAWYYFATDETKPAIIHDRDAMVPGLTLINGPVAGKKLAVRVVESDGSQVHQWNLDWFRTWPDPKHVPEHMIPKIQPGANIQGVVLMDNGDIVFNFESLGLVRLNACSEIVWKLDYRTHHSVHLDESGNLWVSGKITETEKIAKYSNHKPPFENTTLLEVSPDGRILREIPVLDLLLQNGLQGLMYMSTLVNNTTVVGGDTLHLNDIETFPSNLAPGAFARGDVMISLRNINAVMVFEIESGRLKFMTIGRFLRQHDPDFIDGNTISIFDNNNLAPESKGHYSRIITVTAPDDRVAVDFAGSDDFPFFTDVIGNHQRLPNGGILISETRRGRAFEVDGTGKVVWEYFNLVEDKTLALINDAQRLAPRFDQAFFKAAARRCGGQ